MITVLIADDHRVRRSLRALLELEPDMEVVAVVGDGATAVEVAQRLQPDVIVMDVRMPGLDGIGATTQLRSTNPPWGRILIVTTFDLDEYVLAAARAGASGFLLKDDTPEELARAVRLINSGEALVSPRATARLHQEFVRPVSTPTAIHDLTQRELEIVKLMALGKSNHDIANEALFHLEPSKLT
jgi:DNA-binding NarL/FixJ family response regulator